MMHEFPIAERVFQLALDNAAVEGATKITSVRFVLGPLSSVTEESIRFYWDILSQNSPAAGAQLRFRKSAAKLRCSQCGLEYLYPQNDDDLRCPECRSSGATILQGDEFYLESIDIAE